MQGRLGCDDQDLIYFATFRLVDLLEVVEANIAAKSELCRCGLCGGVLSVLDDLQGGTNLFCTCLCFSLAVNLAMLLVP